MAAGELVFAVDLHSDWGADLSGVIARHGPAHVVLHAYHRYEAARHAETFRQQVHSVQQAGCSVGAYLWAFQAYSPQRSVQEAVELFIAAADHTPPVVWVDCEPYPNNLDPGPDVDWLHAAGQAIDGLGLRKGIYTSPGYAMSRWGDRSHELADWLLWLAHWDHSPTLTSGYLPLYGWTWLAGKQWAVRLPNDQEIDRDVFLWEYTVPDEAAPPVPEPEMPEEPDELAVCREQLEACRIALDDVADDRLGVLLDQMAATGVLIPELSAIHAEVRRIREQALGPR